jgi:hypothetical protein
MYDSKLEERKHNYKKGKFSSNKALFSKLRPTRSKRKTQIDFTKTKD